LSKDGFEKQVVQHTTGYHKSAAVKKYPDDQGGGGVLGYLPP